MPLFLHSEFPQIINNNVNRGTPIPIDSRTSHLMKGVPAMDIYSILSSKPHNPHYLNRYITFIEKCQQKNVGYEGYVERHHICPKADDMFPEYIDFRLHPWNCVVLTARQHFIAHIILWKTFPDKKSCLDAIWGMKNTREGIEIKSSLLYEKIRFEITNTMKNMVTVKDPKGNTFSVHKDNPLYIAGEYKHVNKGKIFITNGIKNQLIHKKGPIPKGWRKGMTKISTPKTICITNGIENRRISKNESIYEGWWKGRTGSPMSGKISITNGTENRVISKDISIPKGWQKGKTIDYQWITNGSENKQIPKDLPIPEEWKRGITKNILNKKIFINDGEKEKTIGKGEKIPEGWKIGRLTSSTRGKKMDYKW
jgi:hypothetical protein